MKIGGEVGYRLLRWLRPPSSFGDEPEPHYPYVERVKRVVGEEGWRELRGKTIVDFGCGVGGGTIEMARHGAERVIGLDLRRDALEKARAAARAAGVEGKCTFTDRLEQEVDAVVSLDAFEHFADPAAVLRQMYALLRQGGQVILSFGPTWYHPYGGHLFSIFPWSHLIFSERAQIRWRSEFKDDGATRIPEVAGGMNMLPIKTLVGIIESSPFEVEFVRLVPIRPLAWMQNKLTREFTTAVVECVLRKVPSILPAQPRPTAQPAATAERAPAANQRSVRST